MGARNNISPSLSLLLAASAALTGPVHAGATDSQHVGYRFQLYDEDALDQRDVVGDAGRYRVESQQLDLSLSDARGGAIHVNATHEVMSGSSPWYQLPGEDGGPPVQVLSGASIRDNRSEVSVSLTRDDGGNDTRSVNVSYSKEQDYRALALGIERSLPLDNALTLGYGASVSHDIIQPSDAGSYGRVARAVKNTGSVFASLAWTLSRRAVLETGLQYTRQSGFLSDPYKMVLVDDALVFDHRPPHRDALAWLARYRLAATRGGALHLDGRLVAGSWGQRSLTLDAAWYQTLGGWQLIPGLRYYSQRRADFYAPYFQSGPCRYCSGDYRLGSYGAWSANLTVKRSIGNAHLVLGTERYRADRSFALSGSHRPVPAATSYLRLFAGIDFDFD